MKLIAVGILCVGILMGCANKAPPTLYYQIGGNAGIEKLIDSFITVSYTHLTLPTNREV